MLKNPKLEGVIYKKELLIVITLSSMEKAFMSKQLILL